MKKSCSLLDILRNQTANSGRVGEIRDASPLQTGIQAGTYRYVANLKFFDDYLSIEGKKRGGVPTGYSFRDKKRGWGMNARLDLRYLSGKEKSTYIPARLTSYNTLFLDGDVYRENCYACLLDLTNDFRTALFFATCKYDYKTDSYRPLTKKDIEATEDSKYGVIFHSPNWVLDYLNGGSFEWHMPVVYDPEHILEDEARTDGVTGEQFTQNAKVFCKEIEEAGYDAMIYSNMLWEAYELDLEKLLDYPVWYADYEELPQTPYRFSMWQYSSTGSVPGIEGNVDLNIQLLKK